MNPLLLTLFICICILTALLILKLLDMRRSIRRIRREFSEKLSADTNTQITIASSSPVTRARSRCFGGSFSARMAIKTRLSMPRTSSITISVINPAQIDGSAIHSIVSTKPIRCMTNVTIRSWINRGKNAMLQHYLSHII